jgi:hypothetical protein
MGMAFGEFNIIPQSQTIIVQCCTKPKSFQNKQIVVFRLRVALVPSSTTKGVSIELHKFWFCYDDLLHCVGGTSRKYAFDRPVLPSLWPV